MNDPIPHLIVIHRGSHDLTLYSLPKVGYRYDERNYKIAVGMEGLRTPAGLYHVNHRSRHPSWTMPDSPWVATNLRGTTLKFDDPNNPIKGRWLGLADGVGIHGTADDESIGKDASHGCIRMHVQDVIELYDLVPGGTPVLIY